MAHMDKANKSKPASKRTGKHYTSTGAVKKSAVRSPAKKSAKKSAKGSDY